MPCADCHYCAVEYLWPIGLLHTQEECDWSELATSPDSMVVKF